MNRPLRLLALALLSLGCGERGVSLGAEEPCMTDPLLTAALGTGTEQLPNCASIGKNQLLNASFEAPSVSSCTTVDFCQFPAAQIVGWRTTSEQNQLEIWHDQYKGVPAADGEQFAELDASSQDTLFQDVTLKPGQLMYWSLEHHGRNGVETMEVMIGPWEAPVSQGTIMNGTEAWVTKSGLYRVGDSETTGTRFALASRSGLAEGNLVDNVVFAPVEQTE